MFHIFFGFGQRNTRMNYAVQTNCHDTFTVIQQTFHIGHRSLFFIQWVKAALFELGNLPPDMDLTAKNEHYRERQYYEA